MFFEEIIQSYPKSICNDQSWSLLWVKINELDLSIICIILIEKIVSSGG